MSFIRHIVIFALFLLLIACGEEKQTGPGEIRWDREVCTRCAMSIGDRSFAAQVRGGNANEKAKLYKFDDIGCAVIWLDKQAWKDDAATEIWVNDHRNKKWINAKTAWYVKPKTRTPMDYGLGAQTEKQQGALNFAEAKQRIYAVEKRFKIHSSQSLKPSAKIESTEQSTKENQ